jgi:hypothetical protein
MEKLQGRLKIQLLIYVRTEDEIEQMGVTRLVAPDLKLFPRNGSRYIAREMVNKGMNEAGLLVTKLNSVQECYPEKIHQPLNTRIN